MLRKTLYTIAAFLALFLGSTGIVAAAPIVETTANPTGGTTVNPASCNSSIDCPTYLPYCDPASRTCLPASLNMNEVDDDQCETASQAFQSSISGFIMDNIFWGARFWAIDTLTSFLKDLSVFGFQIGGIFQPLDQINDFLRSQWLNALIWGIIATFGNWLAGAVISAGITLNNNIIANNDLVKYGFGVMLGIANLGLVIGLVWIGIATILRIKNYSMQGTLGRLLIAAVLINFTLGIAGIVLKLGNDVTEAMYKAANPCPGLMTNQFNVVTIYQSLKDFSGAPTDDKPEANNISQTKTEIKSNSEESSDQGGVMDPLGNLVAGLALDYISLIAASVLSFIGALTFFALGVFLLIRYVVIMLLLVFSPLIWLGFVFDKLKIPGFGNLWDGWWENFLKWVFFGPAIVFFIALTSVFLTSTLTSKPTSYLDGMPQSAAYAADGVPFEGSIYKLAQLIAALIISAGGLYVANKFSGVAGSMVMAGVGGGVGLLTGGMQKLGRAAQRKSARFEGSNNILAKGAASTLGGLSTPLQKASLPFGSQLKTVGVNIQPNKVLSKQELRAEDMKTAEEKIKGMNSTELATELQRIESSNIGSSSNPLLHRAERVAILKKLADSGDLDKVKNLKGGAGKTQTGLDRVLSANTKRDFELLGQKFSNVEKGIGISSAAYASVKMISTATNDTDKNTARTAAETEMKKFYGSLTKKDFTKIPVNTIYGKYDAAKPAFGMTEEEFGEFQRVNTKGLLTNPGDINKIAPSVKSENYGRFMGSVLKESLPETMLSANGASQITSLEGEITALRNSVNTLAEKKTRLETQVSRDPHDISSLGELRRVTAEIEALPGKISAKEASITNVKTTETVDKSGLISAAIQPGGKAAMETLKKHLEKENPEAYNALKKTMSMRETGVSYPDTDDSANPPSAA